MKIAKIDAIPIAIPFSAGESSGTLGHQDWHSLNTLLVRVETTSGHVGWGDAFAYHCMPVVAAALQHQIAPLAIGADARDIGALGERIERALHLFGRYGVSVFALSGLDIALWDLKARALGVPLYQLLGGARRERLTAYASLFRYADPEAVAQRCALAREEGYTHVKLHETRERELRAARDTLGDGVPIMLDTNCPWSPEQARHALRWIRHYDLHWLEEPLFPPEDFDALARLRTHGVPIAAGENNCTAQQFAAMLNAGAVDYVQPSVTKVGGVTHQLRVTTLAEAAGIAVMPHSPYFGPGFLATLQLAAAQPSEPLVERFHMDVEASLYPDWVDPVDGSFAVPDGPGLGAMPDENVIRDYQVTLD